MKAPPCFQDLEAKKEIQHLCTQNEIDQTLLKDLCEIVGDHAGSGRKDGVFSEISDVIDRFITRSS